MAGYHVTSNRTQHGHLERRWRLW